MIGSDWFAKAMIGTGLVSLVIAVIQHKRNMRKLNEFTRFKMLDLAMVTATLIFALGVLGLTLVMMHA